MSWNSLDLKMTKKKGKDKKRETWQRYAIITIVLLLLIGIIISAVVIPVVYSEEDNLGVANSLLYQAEKGLASIGDMEIDTTRIDDLIIDSKTLIAQKDYSSSIKKSNEVISLVKLAIDLDQIIKKNDGLMNAASSLGIDTSKEESIAELAGDYFKDAMFERSHEYSLEAKESIIKKIAVEIDDISGRLAIVQEESLSLGLDSKRISTVIEMAITLKKELSEAEAADILMLSNEEKSLTETIDVIKSADNKIEELRDTINNEESNWKSPLITRLDDMLKEGVALLEAGRYDDSIVLSEDIISSYEKAIAAEADLIDNEEKIREAETSFSIDTKELYDDAAIIKERVGLADFEDAKLLNEKLKDDIEKKIADEMLLNVISKSKLRLSIKKLIIDNLWTILFVLLLLVIISGYSGHKISRWHHKRTLKKLHKRERILLSMIKQAQQDYFVTKKLSKEDYEEITDDYQRKIIDTREKLSIMKERYDYKPGKK